jgi:hypothetical protein
VALSEMIGRCEITPTRNVWRRGAIALCQESARAPGRQKVEDGGGAGLVREDAGVRGRLSNLMEKEGCIWVYWVSLGCYLCRT